MPRAAVFALSLMLTGLSYRLLIADGSLIHTYKLRAEVESAQQENEQLKARNAALEAEVADLKSGEAALEARARMSLGMVKKDETFYLIVEPRG